jgi:hypothetical protein
MNARKFAPPVCQGHDPRVAAVRDPRLVPGTGRGFREVVGGHAGVDRVVVGTLATVPLDLESPLPAVSEHIEEDLQHLACGRFRRRRRVASLLFITSLRLNRSKSKPPV